MSVTTDQMIAATAAIVAGYAAGNPTTLQDLPQVIRIVHESLAGLGKAPVPAEAPAPVPAVPVKKSVTPDYIVCLEDGQKLKMLKRHLKTHYGMTPEEYRAKWNLPADYPMTAPNYAAQRSTLAKSIGLGRRG